MAVMRTLLVLASAGLKSRLGGSWYGLMWVSVGPLLVLGAQAFAFSAALGFKGESRAIFLMAGLLPWLFLSQSVQSSVHMLVTRGPMMKAFRLHPLLLVAAQLLEHFVCLLPATLLLVASCLLFGPGLGAVSLAGMAAGLLGLAFAAAALALGVAILQVLFHPTKFVVQTALTVGFYCSPILYHTSGLPPVARFLLALNPVTHLLAPLQGAATGAEMPAAVMARSVLVGLALFSCSVIFWRATRRVVINRI